MIVNKIVATARIVYLNAHFESKVDQDKWIFVFAGVSFL